MMMPMTSVFFVSIICFKVVSCDQREDKCGEYEPGNCSFDNDFCNWSTVNWTIYPNLADLRQRTGKLVRKMACATNDKRHCLTFEYYKWNTNDKLELHLVAFDKGSEMEKSSVILNQSSQLFNETFEVQSQYPFKLIFEGVTSGELQLRNLHYVRQPCNENLSLSTLSSKTVTEPLTATSLTPTPTATDETFIVGVVVAVAVVIGVGVLVFVLFRRKQLHFLKICFKDEKRKGNIHTHASHNAACIVNMGEPDKANDVKMKPADPNQDYDRLDTTTSPQPSEDYYSVIRKHDAEFPAQGPSMPQYSTLNKPRKPGRANPSKRRDGSDDSPYEIKDDTAGFAPQQPSRSGDHKSLRSNTSGQLGGAASAAADYCLLRSADKDTTVTGGGAARAYHCLEADREARSSLEQRQSGTGLYHCLEEDPETQGPQGETGLYHYLEDDPEIQGPQGETGLYHCLEEDPETQGPQGGTGLYHCLEEDQEIQGPQGGTGVYHCLEDDPETQGPQGGTGLYHCLEGDPETQGPQGGTGLYHCLEDDPETQKPRYGSTPYIQEQDPAMTAYRQTASVYDIPKCQRTKNPEKCHYVPDAAQNPPSDSQDGDYNSLDFNGKSFAAERREDAPDKVYSHLNGGDEDAYSEVDRERRREVIDGDYSHVS